MRDPLRRGSAPDRARPAHRGSFKKGHKKRGGRKRGTPNLISADHKKALVEAAYRVGYDGNGKNGCVGYFVWVGETDPTFFYTQMLTRLLLIEHVEGYRLPLERTAEEKDRAVRELIGLPLKNGRHRRTAGIKSRSSGDWTGQPSPIGGLMQLAVENPRAFCTQFLAACLPEPNSRRRRTAYQPPPQAGVGARGVPDRIPDHVMDLVMRVEKTSASTENRKSPRLRTT
jgi:hypothetical protein